MKKTLKILSIFFGIITIHSCFNSTSNYDTSNNVTESDSSYQVRKLDSLELGDNLIAIYKWHENKGMDYYFLEKEGRLLGLDFVKLDSTLTAMAKTNFFSNRFLENYRKIGQRIDSLVRNDSAYSIAGSIDFPFQDYDTWYGGNDDKPDWNKMRIFNLLISKDSASFEWSCDNETNPEELYLVKFTREDNNWKLSYLYYMDLKLY